MELRWVRLTDPAVTPLLTGLHAEYTARYGEVSALADAPAEQFDPPDGAFVVALVDGVTAAGGGLRRVDATTGEVKRMWTSAEHRRRGLARTVLRALEDRARALGYTRLHLETGPAQPEALGLYAHLGYDRIEVYGRYPLARAFARDLAAPPGG